MAYLHFDSVEKSFPGVRVLDGITFGVSEGSVHALLGENGAGKSTLLKILGGACSPDAGKVSLGGAAQDFSSTAQAISAGVAIIYQELHLAPELSVAENLYIGHLPNHLGWVDRKALVLSARARLEMLGEDIDPQIKVGTLSIAQRQMVEIAKALTRDAKVIAFDEPTSSLTSREVDRLFAIIRQLRDQGRAILYVSHRMEEIFELCDSATILRDGKQVETFDSLAGVTADMLITKMVGRSIRDIFHYTPRPHGAPVLETRQLLGPGLRAPISFTVARGEILGFFGLVGAGRSELLKILFGAERATSGSIAVEGKAARMRKPADAIRNGIVLCPEDRKKEGIVPVRSVMENMNLGARRHFSPLGLFLSDKREQENAERYVEKLAIRTPSIHQLIVNLSGGNQQKVILGRWLGEKIKVILLDEPTRGIDVGAKSEIYSIIYDLAQQGLGVVVVSSELPEVMGICDRIIVMRQRAIVASIPRQEATAEMLLQLALPVAEAA